MTPYIAIRLQCAVSADALIPASAKYIGQHPECEFIYGRIVLMPFIIWKGDEGM